VLVVAGNSGVGKSSLVRAGLVAALQQGRFCHQGLPIPAWHVAVFRPSAAPFDYLAEMLPCQLAPHLSLKEQVEFIADCRDKLPEGGDALRNAICALATSIPDSAGSHILLVVDQFEELFTLTPNQERRQKYIDGLLAASQFNSALPIHLVLVLRADFYAHCLENEPLSRCLETNLCNVPRMTHRHLRECIERRLALAAAQAEAGLIDSLLEDAGSEPGSLALLEHVLGQLWMKCGGAGCTLTNQAYVDLGGMRGALGRHADQIYVGLGDENHRKLAQRIFLELVHLGEGTEDTGRRVLKEELLNLGVAREVEDLLARLASGRLITTGAQGQRTFVEISHEALIREWPALREWLAHNREELRLERRLLRMAGEWYELKHDVSALLQGSRLTQGEEWLSRHADAPELVRGFLQASIEARAAAEQEEIEAQKQELARQSELRKQAEARAEAEKQLRQQQESATWQARRSAVHLRWFLYALAGALTIAVGTAWFAYQQQRIQKSHALAAQSAEALTRDPGKALDLAIRSWQTAKTDESYLAITKAFPQSLFTLKHDGPVMKAVFSPDGNRILSASADHSARVWSAEDGLLLATLNHQGVVNDAAFSPDGQRIVTYGAATDACWRLSRAMMNGL
jgi:hypothetical protein